MQIELDDFEILALIAVTAVEIINKTAEESNKADLFDLATRLLELIHVLPEDNDHEEC